MEIRWQRFFAMPERNNLKPRCSTGELYHKNYYREVKDKTGFTMGSIIWTEQRMFQEDYKEISFVCLRPDGSLELPSTLGIVCRKIAPETGWIWKDFIFTSCDTPTQSNLLANGAAQRCTGTVRTLRCQYHNECLRPFHKKSQAGIRKVT